MCEIWAVFNDVCELSAPVFFKKGNVFEDYSEEKFIAMHMSSWNGVLIVTSYLGGGLKSFSSMTS